MTSLSFLASRVLQPALCISFLESHGKRSGERGYAERKIYSGKKYNRESCRDFQPKSGRKESSPFPEYSAHVSFTIPGGFIRICNIRRRTNTISRLAIGNLQECSQSGPLPQFFLKTLNPCLSCVLLPHGGPRPETASGKSIR